MSTFFEIVTPFHTVTAAFVFAVSALITRIMIWVNIPDIPNPRSSHTRATPKGGGLAVVVTFCAGLALACVVGRDSLIHVEGLLVFVALAALIAGISLLDDLIGLSALMKLVMQLVGAVVFAFAVAHYERLWIPGHGMVEFDGFGYTVTILWIVGFMNVFNFLDGVNGLASGGTLIASLFLGVIALSIGAEVVFLCFVLLFPATLGFYVYNFPRGRIFLGEVGSQSIGFIFAGIAVIGASADFSRISFYVVPILFFGFLFDFSVTLLGRLSRGKNLFEAHREHLFQICNRLGLSHVGVCLIYYAFFMINGALAVVAQSTDPFKRLYLVLILLPFYITFAVVVHRVARSRST